MPSRLLEKVTLAAPGSITGVGDGSVGSLVAAGAAIVAVGAAVGSAVGVADIAVAAGGVGTAVAVVSSGPSHATAKARSIKLKNETALLSLISCLMNKGQVLLITKH